LTELLNNEDFKAILSTSLVGEDNLAKQYEAWGIEPDDIDIFVQQLTSRGLASLIANEDPFLELYTAITMGIELGYKMRLEVETRRIANDSGESPV